MKIAYIPTSDPYNKHSWSGTDYYTRLSLENQGNVVYCIYGFKPSRTLLTWIKMIAAKLVGAHYYDYRNKQAARQWARYIKANLQEGTDAILSLGTTQVACLNTEIPLFIMVDGIFEQMRTFYDWGKLSKSCLRDSNEVEQMALDRSTHVVSCSKETGEAIKNFYKIPPDKLSIIPLGANFDNWPTMGEVRTFVERRDSEVCHLLFVGVDWKRKGADIVLETTKILHDKGFPVVLHLCGLKQIPVRLPSYVINHGFLRKSDPKENELLLTLYKTSHFLFVPSVAEAYGLVFCEASAYGLPSISHRLGGLTTIVEDGKNGQLFDLGTEPKVFADYIEKIFSDKKAYSTLAMSSFERFETYLNWDSVGEMYMMLFNKIIKEK